MISLNNNLAITDIKEKLPNKLIISLSEGYRFIDCNDIVRLEGSGNYTKIFTCQDEMYLVSKTMKTIANRLSTSKFVRVHKSHIINVNAIKMLAKDNVQLSDQSTVPISRSNRKMLLEFLGIKK